MLRDAALNSAMDSATGERRASPRTPLPAELVICWHHDAPNSVRYQVIDVSDDGFRIHSSLPLIDGMTGTALSLLPDGGELNEPLMIVWIRSADEGPGYEVGLRRMK